MGVRRLRQPSPIAPVMAAYSAVGGLQDLSASSSTAFTWFSPRTPACQATRPTSRELLGCQGVKNELLGRQPDGTSTSTGTAHCALTMNQPLTVLRDGDVDADPDGTITIESAKPGHLLAYSPLVL